MLSCYGLIGRADAHLVNSDRKFVGPDELQKFWQVSLANWQHFCSVENTRVGANAAIRSDDTGTKFVNSLLLWHTDPTAVRFERSYLAPAFSLVFFRRHEGVARPLQRMIWP